MACIGKGRAWLNGAAQLLNSHLRQKMAPSVAMATAANDVKPFYFQDILEQTSKHDTPFKKLTGLIFF